MEIHIDIYSRHRPWYILCRGCHLFQGVWQDLLITSKLIADGYIGHEGIKQRKNKLLSIKMKTDEALKETF